MFHHGVWIDLADGTYFVFVLAFELVLAFHLLFAKQAAGDVAEGTEPAFALQAGSAFRLILALHLVLEFSLELFFMFRQGFQFTFVCHDESSYKSRLTSSGSMGVRHAS